MSHSKSSSKTTIRKQAILKECLSRCAKAGYHELGFQTINRLQQVLTNKAANGSTLREYFRKYDRKEYRGIVRAISNNMVYYKINKLATPFEMMKTAVNNQYPFDVVDRYREMLQRTHSSIYNNK